MPAASFVSTTRRSQPSREGGAQAALQAIQRHEGIEAQVGGMANSKSVIGREALPSQISTRRSRLNHVAKHSVAELGFEPGALGGMTSPASATVIKSSMLVGNIEKAQAYSPLFTSFSSSAVPRMPPKSQGARLCAGRQCRKSARVRAFATTTRRASPLGRPRRGLVAESQGVPSAMQVRAELVFADRHRRALPDRKNGVENFQQLFLRPVV